MAQKKKKKKPIIVTLHCSDCGAEYIEDGQEFCTECGGEMTDEPDEFYSVEEE